MAKIQKKIFKFFFFFFILFFNIIEFNPIVIYYLTLPGFG